MNTRGRQEPGRVTKGAFVLEETRQVLDCFLLLCGTRSKVMD